MVKDGEGSLIFGCPHQGIAPVALLAGVATNHDGRAATITAPNGTAQQRLGVVILSGMTDPKNTALWQANSLLWRNHHLY